MSRFANTLRLALEDADTAADEVVAVPESTEVDVAAVAEAAEGAAEAGEQAAEAAADAAEAAEGAAEAAEEVAQVVSADDVVVDNAESVEEAVGEVDAAEAQVEEIEAQTDELEEAATGLEAIRELLIEAQQAGGLNPQAARMATLAVESYTTRLGLETPIMASLENFGGDSTRLKATTLSIESISETIKKSWETFVKFVIKTRDMIWNFIKQLFSASERLKQRGEKLSKLKLSGAPKEAKIKVKGLAKKVAVGTKADLNADAGLRSLTELMDGAIKDSIRAGNNTKQAIDALQAYGSGKIDTAALISTAKSASEEFALLTKFKGKALPGNVEVKTFAKELPVLGTKLVYVTLVKNADADRVGEEVEVPTMSAALINQAGATAVALHAKISAAQAQAKKDLEAVKGLKGLSASKEFNSDERKAFNEMQSLVRANASQSSQAVAKICSHSIKTALAYLQLAEKSAAQYGGKAAAPAAAK